MMIEDVVADGCCVYIVRKTSGSNADDSSTTRERAILISEGIRQGTASRTRTPPLDL